MNEERKNKQLFFETYHLTKDGYAIPCEISNRFIEFKGESFYLVLARDISERKELHTEIQASE